MTPDQEERLIRKVHRDPRAFGLLYDCYFPRIFSYVRYRVPAEKEAEDIVADVFFRAIQGLDRFKWRRENSFASWLFRIARNLIVDHRRRRARDSISLESNPSLMEVPGNSPLPEEILSKKESFRQIRALMETLSPRRQEIITLRFFGGLRNREIARILGLDQRTVASHLSRGLRDLEQKHRALTSTGARS